MSYKSSRAAAFLAAAAMVLGLCGCEDEGGREDLSGSAAAEQSVLGSGAAEEAKPSGRLEELLRTDEMFTERDSDGSYSEAGAVSISLSGSSASADSDSVEISGGKVKISQEGVYLISGTLSDGQIIVDADDSAKVQLALCGCEITCSGSAAIYVKQADKVFVTLSDGTENVLTETGSFTADGDTNVDGVIFSKDDLTINGGGSLEINTENGHGAVSKNDLKVTGGELTVNCSGHGLSGKDSVRIGGGSISVNSGKDGIHSENAEDTQQGFIYIGGGDLAIDCGGDGLDVSSQVLTEGGKAVITSGSGSANGEAHTENMMGGRYPMGAEEQVSGEEDESCKGIKGDLGVFAAGGELVIDSKDDGIHSNAGVSVSEGKLEISSGDDGIHGDGQVQISGGSVTIKESYEGIEGQSIDISGGEISVKASDDGLNSSGGNDGSGYGGRGGDMFAENPDCIISISGGKTVVDSSGDGVDSNGSISVTGGEVYVAGPENNGNGALDYAGEAFISGGRFIAAGSSGMAQNFGSSSTQGAALVNISGSGNIILKDAKGEVLIEFDPGKSYGCAVVSCPEMVQGGSYVLEAGGQSTEFVLDQLIYGQGGGMGGMGGRPGGGGKLPGGGQFQGGGQFPDRENRKLM